MQHRTRLVGAAGALTAVGIAAITVVGKYEGLRLTAYRDVGGIPTICFGETRGVKMGDRYTAEQCKMMLKDGLIEFETEMRKCLNDPDTIPDKTYVALLSFSYNVGNRAACHSSVFRAANAGDLRAACNRLPLWNKAGGRVVGGLIKRRDDERELCLAGLTDRSSRIVPTTPPPEPTPEPSEKMVAPTPSPPPDTLYDKMMRLFGG